MLEGVPSLTARRVAAHRIEFDRLPAPFGDPAADELLARDVAGPQEVTGSEHMTRYLRGRTSFFDRVTVSGLEREVGQVATIGAGYDARALRYAKPGVRWFELDHPATQADKLRRLERLGIDVSHITFVGLDLTGGGTDVALTDNGWNPEALSLLLCEGLAVYLDPAVLLMLLEDLRALAGVGTRLAISLGVPVITPEQREARAGFRAAVEAAGEPARNELTREESEQMLAASRWRPGEISERAQRAGFALAAPVWEPRAAAGARPTASRIGRYLEQLFHRRGLDTLPRHLARAYEIHVGRIRPLDVGVLYVERRDGPAWVARVLPSARPLDATLGDAEILRFLERIGFPAERCARPEPVTSHEGQAVLVTEHVAGKKSKPGAIDFEALGDLLGRLHAAAPPPATAARPGGAWHHLVFQGAPRDEVAATVSLLDAASARVPHAHRAEYDSLREAAVSAEDCEGLPQALVHPDFVPPNAIAAADGITLVDWTGAGLGPRLWPLAFLLWAAGAGSMRSVDAVIPGYRRHVQLEPPELRPSRGRYPARPVVFACWGFATGREPLAAVADRLPGIRAQAEAIAARYTASTPPPPRAARAAAAGPD